MHKVHPEWRGLEPDQHLPPRKYAWPKAALKDTARDDRKGADAALSQTASGTIPPKQPSASPSLYG
jgi:hypothetical protein